MERVPKSYIGVGILFRVEGAFEAHKSVLASMCDYQLTYLAGCTGDMVCVTEKYTSDMHIRSDREKSS